MVTVKFLKDEISKEDLRYYKISGYKATKDCLYIDWGENNPKVSYVIQKGKKPLTDCVVDMGGDCWIYTNYYNWYKIDKKTLQMEKTTF